MRKINTNILQVFILLFCATVFVGCEKDSSEIEASQTFYKSTNNYYDELFEEVGVEHNLGLSYIFEQLDQTTFDNAADLQSISQYSILHTRDFLSNSYLISEELTSFRDDEIDNIIEYVQENVLNNTSTPDFNSTNVYFDTFLNSLTSSQRSYFDEIIAVIDDEDMDLNESISEFNKIKNDAKQRLNEEEYYVIVAAVEVGKKSFEYWNSNLNDWIEVATGEDYETYFLRCGCRRWFNWKKVGGADVAGAASGAAAGAAAGLAAGGVGAGPGAAAGAVTTGLSASAGQAVTQIWNHFIK